jgi:hypothetical protein
MELRFAAKAHESVVMGQALGAAVATAVEFLTRAIREKAGAVLQQVSAIGLLLHSVCLLSTTGSEVHMLDDFAGAYEHMDLVLRLEPPVAQLARASPSLGGGQHPVTPQVAAEAGGARPPPGPAAGGGIQLQDTRPAIYVAAVELGGRTVGGC